MNINISKLANQAGFDVDPTGKFGNYSEMHKAEKLAELIVRECTNIILHYTDVDEGVAVAKKQFGVE